MKNATRGLLALAAIVGIGSAFTNAPKHFNGTTYYAFTTGGGHFSWTTTDPVPNKTCNTSVTTKYCTIVTKNGYSPVNDVLPTATQATVITVGIFQ